MKEENKLIWFFKKMIIINRFKKRDRVKEQAEKKRRSDELKIEMCGRAIQGNVCPHACEMCAWNVI